MVERLEQEKKEKMLRVLSELKDKIGEIEALKKQLQDLNKVPVTPEKSRALLEEIRVPSLELIKENERRPKGAGK